MRDGYAYLDPDSIYTDANTGVLKNLAGIAEKDALAFFESAAVIRRLKELKDNPVKVKDSAALFVIHKYLFQDVYSWAGKKRIVEISKDGKQFFPISRFDTAFAYIDKLLSEYRTVDKTEKHKMAKHLAVILDAVNYLHPFREGNGRTQREFLRVLALEKGFELSLNPADNPEIYECYMGGTIDGDTDKLMNLILEIMQEQK